MLSAFDPAHKHYAVHKAYIEGSFDNPNDPPVLEYAHPITAKWLPASSETNWHENNSYRIKPRITTRTISYPEPLKTLILGQVYWVVSAGLVVPREQICQGKGWHDVFLNHGMCFATEADALQCHTALFGEKK